MDKKQIGGNHYLHGTTQPWDLFKVMQSSGSAHVDSCRCNIIKYAFRMKGLERQRIPQLIQDLKKALHYAEEAIRTLEETQAMEGQGELWGGAPVSQEWRASAAAAPFPPGLSLSDKLAAGICEDCGKPSIRNSIYCANCITKPEP